jgi:hypothetical protein
MDRRRNMIEAITELIKSGAVTDNRRLQIEQISPFALLVKFEDGEGVMLHATRIVEEHEHVIVPETQDGDDG